MFQTVERVLADLDNAAECTSTDIEAVHMLRMWRADYLRLAAELDAAAHSFRLIEQGLGQRVDAALADWERRFEAANQGAAARPASAIGRDGWFGRPFRRGRGRAPLATRPEPVSLDQTTPDVALARPLAPSLPERTNAAIAARVLGPFELSVSGAPVLRWNSLKARSVFQYLLIHQGRPVRREVLMELEWPDHRRPSAIEVNFRPLSNSASSR
jgi:hypothetical protein